MSEIDLAQKFPQLEPVKGPPSLYMLNGFGTTVYGRRDADPETGTYVKTLCVCALWIPLFYLRAYRVADAEKGWFFLGREPLSGLAKAWNSGLVSVLVALVVTAGWAAYTGSPEYQARETMAAAEEHAAAGRTAQAAQRWAQVVDGGTSHAAAAEDRLAAAIAEAVTAQQAGQLAGLTRAAANLRHQEARSRLTADLYDRALAIVDARTGDEPRGSFQLLEAIADLAPQDADLNPRREALLERLVVVEPDDPLPASELAVILEERGEIDRCEEILAPHAERLGTLEGARILGQIRAAGGELDASRALLLPYTEGRLQTLQAAQERYDRASQNLWDREIARLEQGEAPEAWYQEYDAADEEGKSRLVQEWVGPRAEQDTALVAAEEALVREAAIVPVALDLGIIMVQGAHGLGGDERRQELEAAEKVFLGIRGYAGDTDEYRLSLGQVYYWLGRPDDGRALFDELIAAHERDPEMLTLVGRMLRDVGAESEARALAEEAWESALDGEAKYAAAHLRALLHTDADDQVLWYQRCDRRQSEIRASLHTSQGSAARGKGRTDEAVKHYRQALAVYRTMEASDATLNNSALVHFALFGITGDRDELRAGAAMMERSVALNPSSRIILGNAASPLIQEAVLDAVGNAIDVTALKSGVDADWLDFLHRDEASRQRIFERFTTHPSAVKARGFLDKVLVLAPRDAAGYGALLTLLDGAADEAEQLKRLLAKLESTAVDHGTAVEQARRFYSGEDSEVRQEEYQARLGKLRQALTAARRQGGVTAAVAAVNLATALSGGPAFDVEVDGDEIVGLAEAAYSASPSAATRNALQDALLFRATRSLAAASPPWADLVQRSRQSVHASYLVPLVLTSGSPLAAAAIGDRDVGRAIDLVVEDTESYPRQARPFDWALLKTARPRVAAELARRARERELVGLWRELQYRLAPTSSSAACNYHWFQLMQDRPAEAAAVLRKTADLGIPIPEEFLGPTAG